MLSKVLRSFKNIIAVNELIEVLFPDVQSLRAAQGVALDGIPTNTIANVSWES